MTILTRRAQLKQLGLARSFLDRHYKMPVTIEQLSHEAALSPYHFIRLFRRVYKQTPHQYLIQRRIEAAKQLLHSTDLSITEICIEIGFESLGSFSTLFRKATGLSPTSYREKLATRYEVGRSEEHTSELQSLTNLVCRLLLEKKTILASAATTAQEIASPTIQTLVTKPLRLCQIVLGKRLGYPAMLLL